MTRESLLATIGRNYKCRPI